MYIALDVHARNALNGDPEEQVIEFEGRWHRREEVRKAADTVAELLAQAGIGERVPVAFVPRNRPVAIAAELGLIAARQTICMVYAFQSDQGIVRDVARASVAAVVAMAQDCTPALLEHAGRAGLAVIALDDAMNVRAIVGFEHSSVQLKAVPDEPEISVHTSGTTGPPKHVGFSYGTIARYIVGQNMMALGRADELPPVPLYFPLGNISGIYSVIPPMLYRMRVVLFDRFTLDGWLDYIHRFQPTTPGLPPAAVRMVLDRNVPKEALVNVKLLMAGAAPLDPTVQRTFEDRYGIPILSSYGATEFGGPVAAMMPAHREEFGKAKIGSVGRAYAGASLRVIDADTGLELPHGEDGLLEVIAPRIGPDWIRTTDIGMIDDDGFLYLRGRADGAIVRGGFKLLPETIERALCLQPAVSGAIVVGLPDDRLGQVPAAVVTIKPDSEMPSIAELEAHLREHVYATHIPARWTFVDRLPLNTSAKPDLAKARELFAQG